MMNKVLVPLARRGEVTPLFIDYGLRSTYLKKLTKYGLAPVLVSPETPEDIVRMFYDECSGVMLMGGTDIEPKFYGARRGPLTQEPDIFRDKLELFVSHLALKDRKPFLGICRGCQMLNVAAGGSLVQHIEETSIRHRLLDDDPTYSGLMTQSRHDVSVQPDTRTAQILGKNKVSTNSAHHQCADRVGDNLLISGRSEDGTPEILEHVDENYFCFGLQCHPEADEVGPLEPFFERFAKAVESYGKCLKV
jgi:putative glutamine amidotransferase